MYKIVCGTLFSYILKSEVNRHTVNCKLLAHGYRDHRARVSPKIGFIGRDLSLGNLTLLQYSVESGCMHEHSDA